MTDFEQQLTTKLHERSERVHVALDLEAVKAGGSRPTAEPARKSRLQTRILVAAASVTLVGAGLVALTQLRTGELPSDAAEQPPPPDPYDGLPRKGPTLTDHWHVPYGINLCGEWIELEGDLEDTGTGTREPDEQYAESGIHSHDDGLMHVHPFGSAGVGANATLGTFLDNYGVALTDDSLSFPSAQADGRRVSEGTTSCAAGDASLAVIVWPDPDDPTNKVIVTDRLAGTPLGADRIVMAVAFTDDPASIEMPPSAAYADETSRLPG